MLKSRWLRTNNPPTQITEDGLEIASCEGERISGRLLYSCDHWQQEGLKNSPKGNSNHEISHKTSLGGFH